MNWKSHAIIAFALGLILFGFVWPHGWLLMLALAMLSSISALLPDLDHDMSKGRAMLNKFVPFIALITVSSQQCNNWDCLLSSEKIGSILLLTAALVGIYAIFFTFLKPRHRGITHSLAFTVLYGVVLYLIAGFTIAIAGFAGYASHLLADKEIKII